MVALLATHLRTIPEVAFQIEPQVNSIFVTCRQCVRGREIGKRLHRRFHTWLIDPAQWRLNEFHILARRDLPQGSPLIADF